MFASLANKTKSECYLVLMAHPIGFTTKVNFMNVHVCLMLCLSYDDKNRTSRILYPLPSLQGKSNCTKYNMKDTTSSEPRRGLLCPCNSTYLEYFIDLIPLRDEKAS